MTDRNQLDTVSLLRQFHRMGAGISLDELTQQRDEIDALIDRLKTVPAFPDRALKFSINYTLDTSQVSISQTAPQKFTTEDVVVDVYIFPTGTEDNQYKDTVRVVCIPSKQTAPCPSDHDALNWTALWFQFAERSFMGRNGYVKNVSYSNMHYIEDGAVANIIPDSTSEELIFNGTGTD